MRRFCYGLAALAVCLLLLVAAVGFVMASVYLALSQVMAFWLAALATALSAVLLAVVVMVATSVIMRKSRATGDSGLPIALVRLHPLGAAGAALTAGILTSSSPRVRFALMKGVLQVARSRLFYRDLS